MLDENDAARGLIRAVLQERVQLRLGEQMQIKMKDVRHWRNSCSSRVTA
jgi:hypothetical protein